MSATLHRIDSGSDAGRFQCSQCQATFPPSVDARIHAAGCVRYNGWTNHETWAVNLWLTNDELSYETLRAIARDDTNPSTRAYAAAQNLKDYVESLAVDACRDAGMFADLLQSALDAVDWASIITAAREK